MKLTPLALGIVCLALPARRGDLRIPAYTAYIAPNPEGASVSRDRGVSAWTREGSSILWFGQFKTAGKVQTSVAVKVAKGRSLRLRLGVATETHDATAQGDDGEVTVPFGEFSIAAPGYHRFELQILDPASTPSDEITALVLDGAPAADAHFNLDPRRNAASVHLRYPIDTSAQVVGFYNEVTAVEDPVTTYYMACGFSRGYFGMQVNSLTERRIIFSIWDAGAGSNARDRSTVAKDDQTQLLDRGDGVVANAFGNEGTGGHSHLVYNWKTGSTQRFYVTVTTDGTFTDYSGYWFHPDKNAWQLIARFRAPRDGKTLRGLYSFSENFGSATGHVKRKALFGPQWIRLADGQWRELVDATFSHDATGKENRLDRFMGIEAGRFFLSHGGFVDGVTTSGEKFTRPASGVPPDVPINPGRGR